MRELEEQLRACSTEMTRAAAAAAQNQLADAAAAAQSRESIVRELEVRLNGATAAKTRQEREMVQRQEVGFP